MATGTPVIKEAVERACTELGYTIIKEKQKEVILNFVLGRDVFAALPTGYGNSLCYGCLPGVFDRVRSREGSIAAARQYPPTAISSSPAVTEQIAI